MYPSSPFSFPKVRTLFKTRPCVGSAQLLEAMERPLGGKQRPLFTMSSAVCKQMLPSPSLLVRIEQKPRTPGHLPNRDMSHAAVCQHVLLYAGHWVLSAHWDLWRARGWVSSRWSWLALLLGLYKPAFHQSSQEVSWGPFQWLIPVLARPMFSRCLLSSSLFS